MLNEYIFDFFKKGCVNAEWSVYILYFARAPAEVISVLSNMTDNRRRICKRMVRLEAKTLFAVLKTIFDDL